MKKKTTEAPETHTFTDDEQLQLKTLNEYVLLYSHQIRRLVGAIAEKHGIDMKNSQVGFDLEKMTYTVVAIPPTVDK